jgi:predicted enzyme related to lactoylglutathione lyase
MDFKLEPVPVPVSDVDRAKTFYADEAGFNVDLDFSHGETFRVVQLTPPGSARSIAIGVGGGRHGGGLDPGPASGRR